MAQIFYNETIPRQFYLLAFTNLHITSLTLPLFFGVLIMYLVSVLGNLIITILVCQVSKLHTPMYFFLCNLAVQDIIYVSSILPKTLAITLTGDTAISFEGCIIQIFVFAFCIGTEFFLLTSMAYDRYVAICIPLRYSLIMNKKVCSLIATTSWLFGGITAWPYSVLMSNISFCKSHEINHLFCNIRTLLRLSCSKATLLRSMILTGGTMFGIIPFIMIIVSYAHIIFSIHKIHTSAGKMKAFSSCSSHIVVVIIFFGATLSLHLKPETENSEEIDKVLSLLYVAFVPMVNPLVYSLRNHQVTKAIKKLLKI
ncbi:hypothetical protein GDO86_006788 [Hymenochirus boettgeri]|uniref:Olfactory receptor n=1 Tax=Hymenochirus boettgeri TaxID=247094 RepID=A0A8T2J7G3_9PIPI|nr:hypothetical protein GDO86_006788 [Hymenochirus boettgeri]